MHTARRSSKTYALFREPWGPVMLMERLTGKQEVTELFLVCRLSTTIACCWNLKILESPLRMLS